MLYYTKAEQASLATQDLNHAHLAFAGIWNWYHTMYRKFITTENRRIWAIDFLSACVMDLCDGQHLSNADFDMYIDAVMKTVVRIQSIECIQQHVITTASVLAQL